MKDIDVLFSFTPPKVFMNRENDKFYLFSALWGKDRKSISSCLLVVSRGMNASLYFSFSWIAVTRIIDGPSNIVIV